MYFSGHLIDGFSKHLSSIKTDKISEIIEQLTDEGDGSGRYSDKSTVTIAGIITSKRTKVTKSGDVMAYITVEDRFAEIDVVVFAKSYRKYSELLAEDNAVSIVGNIATEEGEAPRILLSSATQLIADAEYDATAKSDLTVYIKVKNLDDSRINNLKRISALNRGNAKIVLFDESRRKYCALKDAGVDANDSVMQRLSTLFGRENVILK